MVTCDIIAGIAIFMGTWWSILQWKSWLVVYLPLWKIWVGQLGWWHSQLNGTIKFHGSKPPTRFDIWWYLDLCISHEFTILWAWDMKQQWWIKPSFSVWSSFILKWPRRLALASAGRSRGAFSEVMPMGRHGLGEDG